MNCNRTVDRCQTVYDRELSEELFDPSECFAWMCERCRHQKPIGGCMKGIVPVDQAENEQRWAKSADAFADMLQGKTKLRGM